MSEAVADFLLHRLSAWGASWRPSRPTSKLEQARALAAALRAGDPDARSVLRESVRQKLADLVKRD